MLPQKLDVSQLLSDYNRFERSVIWKEFWETHESEDRKISIFNIKKENLPRKQKVPEG